MLLSKSITAFSVWKTANKVNFEKFLNEEKGSHNEYNQFNYTPPYTDTHISADVNDVHTSSSQEDFLIETSLNISCKLQYGALSLYNIREKL